MSNYLGRGLEQVDNISKLDNITFNGGTTYALTKDSSAFTPISSNALLISVSGVIQQGNFSVDGTNIVFNSAVAGTESCDFIMHYGTGVAFTPADSSITKDKTNFISNSSSSGITSKGDGGSVDGSIALNCSQNSHHTRISSSPHSAYAGNLNFVLPSSHGTTGQLMKTDGSGNLSFVDAPSGGLAFVGQSSSTSEVSNLTLDNVFTSTYTNYLIIGEYTLINGSGPACRFRFRTGGSSGSDLSSSQYNYHWIRYNADSNSTNNLKNNADAACDFSAPVQNDSANVSFRLCWTVYDPLSSTKRTALSGHGRMTATDGHSAFMTGSCDYKATTSVTGIVFYSNSDNVKNGHFRVYGIVDS